MSYSARPVTALCFSVIVGAVSMVGIVRLPIPSRTRSSLESALPQLVHIGTPPCLGPCPPVHVHMHPCTSRVNKEVCRQFLLLSSGSLQVASVHVAARCVRALLVLWDSVARAAVPRRLSSPPVLPHVPPTCHL